MKNLCISLFLVLMWSYVKSQKTNSLDLIATSKVLNQNTFSNKLNTFKNFIPLQPLNYIGICFSGGFKISNGTKEQNTQGYLEFSKLMPQKLIIQDSIQANLRGFNIGIMLFGYDWVKLEKIDFTSCFGFNFGRIWLKGDDSLREKNAYFSPSFALIPRINFKKLSIHARCAYDFDVSNKNWKRKGFGNNNLIPLNPLSFQGLHFSLGFGLNL